MPGKNNCLKWFQFMQSQSDISQHLLSEADAVFHIPKGDASNDQQTGAIQQMLINLRNTATAMFGVCS
jgi:hypothetical protein